LTTFSVDRLRLVFLPRVRTALHAEARCDSGSVTYNIINIITSLHGPMFFVNDDENDDDNGETF